MAFSSQAFRAPSLTSRPKLGKTTVSSSVFRGTTKAVSASKTIKVPAGMGYGSIYRGASVDPKYLKKEGTPLEQTLVETNNILVEIQKQLSADFSYRIAKENEETKKIRAASDKKKRIAAEQGAEGVKKVGSVIGGVADKVLAPARSIFDKILGFLSAVVTGFIVDKALTWLSKDENRAKIDGVFNFVKDNWKWILGIIGGVLIGRVIYKMYRIYRALRGIARFVTGRGGAPGRRKIGTRLSPAEQRYRSRFGDRAGDQRFGERPKGNLLRQSSGKVRNNIVAKSVVRLQDLASKAGKNVVGKLGLKGISKFLRPILKGIPIFGALIDFAVSMALGEPIGRAAAKAIGAGLGGALGSLIPIPGVGMFLGGWAGDWVGGTLYDWITKSKESKELKEGGADEAEGMNRGGTVTGRNVGDRDSVPTILTVGEKVVPREQSKPNKFGPFVDDIIRDRGSLYVGMVNALKEQEESSKVFKKTNEQLETILKKQEEKNKLKSNPPSIPVSPAPKPKKSSASSSSAITPTVKDTSSLQKETKRGPETIMLPMQKFGSNIPPSATSMAPAPGGSSIPTFDAEDPENTYIEYMKMQFGIFGV